MKYHYVYIITNKINHKFYIGKHSTNNLDDGYMGSGKVIKNATQKYGLENFNKRILCFCDSAEDALEIEKFLVTENLIKREDCYNANIGGKGGSVKGRKFSEEAKKHISESLIGNQYAKGKHHTFSEEHRHKIGEANKRRARIKFNKNNKNLSNTQNE